MSLADVFVCPKHLTRVFQEFVITLISAGTQMSSIITIITIITWITPQVDPESIKIAGYNLLTDNRKFSIGGGFAYI